MAPPLALFPLPVCRWVMPPALAVCAGDPGYSRPGFPQGMRVKRPSARRAALSPPGLVALGGTIDSGARTGRAGLGIQQLTPERLGRAAPGCLCLCHSFSFSWYREYLHPSCSEHRDARAAFDPALHMLLGLLPCSSLSLPLCHPSQALRGLAG